jgi:hypothetical protein
MHIDCLRHVMLQRLTYGHVFQVLRLLGTVIDELQVLSLGYRADDTLQLDYSLLVSDAQLMLFKSSLR